MKYSLKEQYRKILNEEIASIKSKRTNFEEELYNISFDNNGEISSGKKIKVSDEYQERIKICNQFTVEPSNKVLEFIRKHEKVSPITNKKHGITIRKYVEELDLNGIVNRLNKYYRETIFWKPNTAKRIGRGEVSANLAFYTLVPGVPEYTEEHSEPDFVALKNKNNLDPKNYIVTENIFKYFVKFLEIDTTFRTPQEKLFEKAYLFSNNTSILKEYENLKSKLLEEKINSVLKNEDILSRLLQDQIVLHFFYREGMYQNKIKNDKVIYKAVSLLENEPKYYQILSGK